MQKRICITGGCGFIGQHLSKLIPNAVILDKQLDCDITSWKNEAKYDFSLIIHLAARHHIPSCEKTPKETIDTNIWGTLNLIRLFPNARIVVASSSAANDIKSVYGYSKYCMEQLGKLHKDFLAIRFYNVFGDGQRLESDAAIPKFINTYLSHEPLTVYGDGEQSRDFTYVRDLVPNILELALSNRTGLAHLGYGNPISIKGILRLIYGFNPDITYMETRKEDILYSCSPEPMKVTYGREEGIRRTIEWFKSEYRY